VGAKPQRCPLKPIGALGAWLLLSQARRHDDRVGDGRRGPSEALGVRLAQKLL
jgi:hypothetical protein